jgi:chloramphenicol 3-O-phosphotransferase
MGSSVTKRKEEQLSAVSKPKRIRILLLGIGDVGKSTICKQMQMLCGQGFSKFHRANFKQAIHTNVIQWMQGLIKAAEMMKIPFETEVRDAFNCKLSCGVSE